MIALNFHLRGPVDHHFEGAFAFPGTASASKIGPPIEGLGIAQTTEQHQNRSRAIKSWIHVITPADSSSTLKAKLRKH